MFGLLILLMEQKISLQEMGVSPPILHYPTNIKLWSELLLFLSRAKYITLQRIKVPSNNGCDQKIHVNDKIDDLILRISF